LVLDTAQVLLGHIYKWFGLPDKMISDHGPQFAAESIKELLRLLGIQSSLSMAYHPQSDGITERYNQEIEVYLMIYCVLNPEDWHKALPTLEFSHSSRHHSDCPQTPYELLYGTRPIALPMTYNMTKFPTLDNWLNSIRRYQCEASDAHELAQNKMASRIKADFVPFKK